MVLWSLWDVNSPEPYRKHHLLLCKILFALAGWLDQWLPAILTSVRNHDFASTRLLCVALPIDMPKHGRFFASQRA